MFWIVGLVDSLEMLTLLTLNPTGFVNRAGVMGLDAGWAVIIH
jgi:hypothetical protein